MASQVRIDISHIPKFDGTYFHIWKHRLTLLFKSERLYSIVSGTEGKPVQPSVAEILAGVVVPPANGLGSIINWEDKDTIALTIITNCLDNNIVSHIQSKLTSNEAWQELIRIFESHDAIAKMYLKDNIYNLKMKEGESMVRHIHTFRSLCEQLAAAGAALSDEDAVLHLMRSMPSSYRNFISSMRR